MNHASQVLRYLRTRIGLGPDGKAAAPENDNRCDPKCARLSNPFLPELPLQESRTRFTLEQHDSIRYYIEQGRPDLAAQMAMQFPPTTVCLFAFLTNQNPSSVKDGKSVSEYAEDAIILLSGNAHGEVRTFLIGSLERFLSSRFLGCLGAQDPARQARLRSEFTSMHERLQ